MIRTIITFLILLCGMDAWAVLPPPPVINNVPTQQYFQYLYDNHNVITIITSPPNGSRRGKVGEVVIYNNVGTFTIWANSDGDTTWKQL